MTRSALAIVAPGLAWLIAGCLNAPQPRDFKRDCPIFPADNPWNTDVSGYAVHERSDAWIDAIGRNAAVSPRFGAPLGSVPHGVPFVQVLADQPRVPITFMWADESDPGPYPIPPGAPIEAGDDSNDTVIVLDVDDCALYELIGAERIDGGASWAAEAGAKFDLESNELRPEGWTSADSAGLPIFPGLIRYDELVEDGVIPHALRFSSPAVQSGFIPPARHTPGTDTDPDLPPTGARVRMKASYDCSALSAEAQVVCATLKTYGMLLASRGGAWYLSGAPDERWDDDALAELGTITGDAFEVVDTGEIIPR